MKRILKKIASVFILTLVLATGFTVYKGVVNPTYVYAGDKTISSKDISLDMEIDEKGKLNNGLAKASSTKSFNTIFQKTKIYILAFSGLATLIFVGLGIKQSIAIGTSAGNPNARSAALSGLLWILIAAAICGSITLVVAIAWNFGK